MGKSQAQATNIMKLQQAPAVDRPGLKAAREMLLRIAGDMDIREIEDGKVMRAASDLYFYLCEPYSPSMSSALSACAVILDGLGHSWVNVDDEFRAEQQKEIYAFMDAIPHIVREMLDGIRD